MLRASETKRLKHLAPLPNCVPGTPPTSPTIKAQTHATIAGRPPVAYQVILEPFIGQFRELESPPNAYSQTFVGIFSCAQNRFAESASA